MEEVTLNCCGIKFWYMSKFKNKGFDDRRDSPYEETQLISSDNVYFGDPQIITYSAGRDLKISTFRAPIFRSAYWDLKIPARGRCDQKIARSNTANQEDLTLFRIL